VTEEKIWGGKGKGGWWREGRGLLKVVCGEGHCKAVCEYVLFTDI